MGFLFIQDVCVRGLNANLRFQQRRIIEEKVEQHPSDDPEE